MQQKGTSDNYETNIKKYKFNLNFLFAAGQAHLLLLSENLQQRLSNVQ